MQTTSSSWGADLVVCATGAHRRRNGPGSHTPFGIADLGAVTALTPDEFLAGDIAPAGRVVVYDDYYMAGALAQRLAAAGHRVTYVTPAARVSACTEMTNEQHFVQAAVLEAGVDVMANAKVVSALPGRLRLGCVFTDRETELPCDTLVLVTARVSDGTLYRELAAREVPNLVRVGDCEAPGAIVHAIYAGHRYARELDADVDPDMPCRRERVTA